MVKVVGNLKKLIDDSAAGYIDLNVDKFKSTTPGPKGDDGLRGPQGVGVHHMKGTSTTDSEGDFSTAGELDTYTFYADAHEEFPLAWFTVKNGEDPWKRAIDRGYRGTEEEFYTLLGSVEEYATIALESIDITEENKQIILAAAAQVAADKLIVEQNMNKIPEIEDRLDVNESTISTLELEDADNKLRLDLVESDVSDLGQRVETLEGDTTVVGSVDNKIELSAQDAIYDDDNDLGAGTVKEALDKLVLDLYKVKEW